VGLVVLPPRGDSGPQADAALTGAAGGNRTEHVSRTPPYSGGVTQADPELNEIAGAWPQLPVRVRAGILARVRAAATPALAGERFHNSRTWPWSRPYQ